jgi:Tol biopolymer transport system component/predicted DNA-binding transcriptional regulator AlpA
MAESGQPRPKLPAAPSDRGRLSSRLYSWKEIASYLGRSEKTLHRWEEKEGLPVHRLHHEKRGSVYAYTSELEAWWDSRKSNCAAPDEAPHQQFPRQSIESLAGEGNDSDIGLGTETAVLAESAASRAARAQLWVWTFVALMGVLAEIYALHQSLKDEGVPSLTAVPLTSYPGKELQPSLSPDGNLVAFAFSDDGSSNYHIYVKVIGSEEVLRLTSSRADDLSPSWSPDGQSIVFLRFISDQRALVIVIPSKGGEERQLSKINVDRTQTEIRVTWSPNGEWIATSDAETQQFPMGLVLISAKTGEKRRLVYQPPPPEADLSPSFSPDARYLAFARHVSPVVADIYVLELFRDGGSNTEARRLTNWNRMNRNPLWTGNGQDLLFVGDEPGLDPRIWRISAFQATNARPINQIGEGGSSLALCPRRNRLVYAKETEDRNIWRIDFDSGSASPAHHRNASPTRLIASTRLDTDPQYSPDGKYIAYQSERSGDSEIWVANRDGSASRQLTRLHAKESGYPRWSPNGKHIVFHSRPNGYANVYVIDVETGAYQQLTTGTTNDSAPSWSHDGKWIYFCSERDDGSQIWRVPADGGPASRLTKTGGAIALESADGKQLFYSKFTEPGLWVLPFEGGVESRILPSLYSIDTFAVTKRGIYFVRRTAHLEASVSFMSFSLGVTRNLARVKSFIGDGLSVSPDGSSILYTQVDQTGSDLILVDNFK